MTPQEFLKAVWPEEGLYCIAVPHAGQQYYDHYVRDTLAKALHVVERFKQTDNIFFAIHALKEEKVWNPDKENKQTGELGAWEKRVQRNMRAARCFFFDLDVGDSAPTNPKYATQKEAFEGLRDFCAKAQLPRPLVASSGGGLHVYFLLTDEIASEEWKTHAAKLRALAKHHGLKFDPARTVDTASVLRVVGAYNHKHGQKRPVVAYVDGQRTPTGEFLKLLDDATIRAGITVKETPRYAPAIANPFEDNVSQNNSLPPPSLMAVMKACKLTQYLVSTKGNVSEPVWHKTLNLFRFVENGHAICHRWSEGSPTYDRANTEDKIARLEQVRFEDGKPLGPTLCARLVEELGTDAHCQGCLFAAKNSSPIHAARVFDEAPPPVIRVQPLDAPVCDIELPPAPSKFKRLKTGIGMTHSLPAGGGEEIRIIYENDLYPVRRMVNSQRETEQLVWRVHLPRVEPKDFTLDADALYDRTKFTRTLSNHGVYPKGAEIPYVQEYMIAYIKELQRAADAEKQLNHLGWADDERSAFIMPDRLLLPDGTSRTVSLSKSASRASQALYKRGTLEKQIELLRFYRDNKYVKHQAFILASIAAPIFHATNQHGCIVNATGLPGAGKSTALYTAAGIWGNPKLYAINGTRRGATENFRLERLNVMSNLPIMIDEITHLSPEEAKDIAMAVSQPTGRGRLEVDGTERLMSDSLRSTVMLTTANSSLHSLLSSDNAAGTAGAMRVIEMSMMNPEVHQPWEADDYLTDLAENFGHIGEIYAAKIVRDSSYVQDVRHLSRRINQLSSLTSGERFYPAIGSTTYTGGKIMHGLGLIDWDLDNLMRFIIEEQIPSMRGVVKDEYTTAAALLANFLDRIDANIIVTQGSHGLNSGQVFVVREPRGALLAHYDMEERRLYVSKSAFKADCTRRGANSVQVLKECSENKDSAGRRLVQAVQWRKTLGAGTNWAKMQTNCFIVNMEHEDVGEVKTELIRTSTLVKEHRTAQ